MSCKSTSSINGEGWIKESILLGMSMCFAEAALVRRSAFSFSSLRIWTNLAYSLPTCLLTCSRYFFIFSPLNSKSSFTWLVTTWESQYTITLVAPVAVVRSNLATKVLYYASLFVVRKSRRTMHLISSPFGEWSITLASLACLLDDPFVWMLHWGYSSAP